MYIEEYFDKFRNKQTESSYFILFNIFSPGSNAGLLNLKCIKDNRMFF